MRPRSLRVLASVAGSVLGVSVAEAGVVFSIDTSPPLLASGAPDPQGLSFATSVEDFTSPIFGTAADILGQPDATGGIVPGIVDFNGAVTVGFAAPLVNAPGVDVKLFVTQLDPSEGFDLYAGPTPGALTLLANYPGPSATLNASSPLTIDIDFADVVLPAGALYLRFVNNTPINSVTFTTDFDAVGVTASTSIPEPASAALLAAGVLGMAVRRAGGRRSRARPAACRPRRRASRGGSA